MSVPYPTSSNPLPRRPETPMESDSAPIKPFRPAPAFVQKGNALLARFRVLYDDKREWNRVLLIAILMLVAIAASVVGKTGATYGLLALFVGSILLISASDAWGGLLLFVVYTSMEGMFKYTTQFSSVVYAIAPVLAVYIFVVWRIASRVKDTASDSSSDSVVKEALISQKAEKGAPFPSVAPLLFALGLLHVVQIFNPESAGLFGATAGTVTWYLAPMVLFFVAYFTVRNSKQLVAFIYLIIGVAAVTSAYALAQYFLGEEWCYANIVGLKSVNRLSWFNVGAGGTEAGVFRPVSTFSGPGGYVFLSLFGIVGSILVSQMDRMAGSRRLLVICLAVIMAIAMLIAGVRLVLVNGALVIVLVLALSVRTFNDAVRIYFLSFLVLFAGATAFVITDNLTGGKIGRRIGKTFTDPFAAFKKNRGYHFETLMDTIRIRPFGIGVQRAATDWRTARQSRLRDELLPFTNRETQWNATQADAGILGVILLGAVFIVFLRDGWIIFKRVNHPRLRLVVIYFGMIILSNTISSFGAPVMQSNFLFWIAAGCLYAVPRIYARENRYLLSGDLTALEPVVKSDSIPVKAVAV